MPSLRPPDGGERCFRRETCCQPHMVARKYKQAINDGIMGTEHVFLF